MSGGKNGKNWTAGTLKSRGWTEALTKELLPKPMYRHFNGRSVRTWNKETVLEAEKSERFIAVAEAEKRAREEAEGREKESLAGDLSASLRLLDECWRSPEEDTSAAKLAALYHKGIRSLMAGASQRSLREGKALSYAGHLLALRQHAGDGDASPATEMKRFAASGYWLGRAPENLKEKLREGYTSALLAAAERAAADFAAAQPETDIHALLTMEDFPVQELMSHPLSYIYSVHYVPRAIRSSLELLVALNPKDEYPEARALQRHFVVHIGGTNTGKTYAGFQRLIRAQTGVYLAPLRLLALEAQETLLDYGVNCSLTTGEEEDVRQGDTHVAATAEKLDMKRHFDVAVIDECQMISDRERGYAWTRAILGVLAEEVHLCAAPEAKNLLLRLIRACGDSFEVIEHQRKTPLLCMNRVVDYLDIQPGDALITFSKVGVLSVAEDLRMHGKEAAIIYGALPYATRRKQVEGFLNHERQYVVSTDAIGMGLNLPIRRIIFMDTSKFDGRERRPLKPEEVQQIAGRAGRYGIYDKGYVGATENLSLIQTAMETVVPPLTYAVAGFSDLVLMVDFDLLEVLEVWNRMPTVEPYQKLDITRYITIISQMRERGFRFPKEQELAAANIPFDETDDELIMLFYRFLRAYSNGEEPEQPVLQEKKTAYTLPELELYYRKLDLYFSFCKAFSCPVDTDALKDEREKTADLINMILLHNLRNNIRFCDRCGAAMPLHHSGRICNDCYARIRRGYSRKRG
ncbi:MAG: hypothetical protein IKO91_01835 [Oscillospiraceae bacterium]|nr:hypothetical protein [Oscillospiraceae bacterium]